MISYIRCRGLAIPGAILLSAVAFPRASAQTNVGLSGGTEYGFGAIGTAGTRATQLEVGGGFAPVLFLASDLAGNSVFRGFLPAAVGAKLSVAVNKQGLRRAIKFGATYNSLIKLGFGGGFDAWIKDRVKVAGGVMLYPKAKKSLIERINKDDGTSYTLDDFESTAVANLQPFIGFGLFFR